MSRLQYGSLIMVFWDGQRYVAAKPTLIPDIPVHLANWRRFRKLTGEWPILSILMYVLRFAEKSKYPKHGAIIMIAGVVIALWHGVAGHGWSKGQYYLSAFAVVMPLLIVWFILERRAWNRDLQQYGLASSNDVWGVTQFPEH